ncbi:S53 family peptidase [Allobranchiibius sp. GilTou38]|uniref:S53 family peptidase n=1 Tax=Allobranchiibius sp. GilTou38 TaxID=2815210 RepID=UPI001AA0F78F|nr:S53 family peptidase [Allobranchiibius sp. GilTou38]MBO1765414.1 S8/S53 family peptidase [Allobranchiibius sp. GilTou38]
MKRRSLAAVTAVLTTASVVPAAAALAATPNGAKTTLSNSSVSTSGLRLGANAPGATAMSLTLQLPQRNAALMARMTAAGAVVSTARYRALFAPTAAQLAHVTSFAKSHGMVVDQVDAAGGQVMVHTTASHVSSAFGVTVRRASAHGVSGVAAIGTPVVDRSIGLSGVAGLSTLRRAKVDNAHLAGSSRKTINRTPSSKVSGGPRGRISATATDGSTDCATHWGDHLQPSAQVYAKESNLICGYVPQDLAKIQGMTTAVQTNAPSIGLLLWGNDPNMLSETNTYMAAAKYPALKSYTAYPAATNAQILATQPGCDPYGAGSEQSIDVQSSHSVSPNSPIYYYGAKSCQDADLTSELSKMVNDHKVSTISMSFGEAYDQGLTAADKAAWDRPLQQANLTGISTFASSGDSGDNSDAAGNDLGTGGNPDNKPHIGYPASSTYTTAVGGSSVGLSAAGSLVADVGWEDAYYQQKSLSSTAKTRINFPVDGAGGGVSQVSTIPTWQKGKVTTSTTMRAVPDVAGLANPYTGFTVRDTAYPESNGVPTGPGVQEYDTYGGTSLASPMVAATVALAKAYNKVSIGNAAPRLYALLGTSALRDLNGVNTAGAFVPSTKYPAGVIISLDGHPINSLGRQENLVTAKGWDNVTGVGELNGLNFIKAFK